MPESLASRKGWGPPRGPGWLGAPSWGHSQIILPKTGFSTGRTGTHGTAVTTLPLYVWCPPVCPLTVPHWPLKMRAEQLPHRRLQVASVPPSQPLRWEEGSWRDTAHDWEPRLPSRHLVGPGQICVEGRTVRVGRGSIWGL